MTLCVVDGLQSDDIDVGDDELGASSAAAIQFAVKVGQAGRSRAGACQRVGLGNRQLACERLAVNEGVAPLPRPLFAVLCCGLAVLGGQRVLLGCQRADVFVAPALLCGAHEAIGLGERASAVLLRVGAVVVWRHQPAGVRRVVSGQCGDVAGICDDITLVGCGQAPLSGLIALIRGSIAFIGRLIALIRGVLALIGTAQARLGGLIALIGVVLALIGGVLALIGTGATRLSGLITPIGCVIAFIGKPIALIGVVLALIGPFVRSAGTIA